MEDRKLAEVLDVRYHLKNNHVEIWVELEYQVPYEKYELPEENMVLVTLINARLSAEYEETIIPIPREYLKAIRVEQYHEDAVAMFLEVEGNIVLGVRGQLNPPRMIIRVSHERQSPQ